MDVFPFFPILKMADSFLFYCKFSISSILKLSGKNGNKLIFFGKRKLKKKFVGRNWKFSVEELQKILFCFFLKKVLNKEIEK